YDCRNSSLDWTSCTPTQTRLIAGRQANPALGARPPSEINQTGTQHCFLQVVLATGRRRAPEVLGDAGEPIPLMRGFRQGWQTGPLTLPRLRSEDDTVICYIDGALLALDFDVDGALLAGPCQVDLAGAGNQIKNDTGRVFERPFVKAAIFQHRADGAR